MNVRAISPALLALGLLSGCHGTPTLAPGTVTAQQRVQAESERQELELIPPPSKMRYLAVHTLETWENPYLTIQSGMVTLHVLIADSNPTSYNAGGLTRPVSARRQDLNISLDKLGEALSSIPRSAWPYGRVAAIEEAHNIPAGSRPEVRRTMESAMKTLNDLGVVVYEWNEAGPGLR